MPRTGRDFAGQNSSGRREFTVEALRELCRLQVTHREIAAYFGVSLPVVEERLSDPEFKAAYDAGQSDGHMSLRRAQHEAALKGDRVMLIWLGKQWLGQREPESTSVVEHKRSFEDMSSQAREKRLAELLENREERKAERKAAAKAGREWVVEQAAKQRQA